MIPAKNQVTQSVADGNYDWRTLGACVDHSPDIFFDFAEKFPEVAQSAKAICHSCPFQQRCLDTAMLADEEWGIWGGMTPEERKAFRPVWERRNGGRGAIRSRRNQVGILIHDPSIERRYIARYKASQECRNRALQAGDFPRRAEFMSVLELILAHPREDSGALGRRLGRSKAWFNTTKRDAYAMFGVEENYEEEVA